MSLVDRVEHFNTVWASERVGKEPLTLHKLRCLYRGVGITIQKVTPRLGKPALENYNVQMRVLRETWEQVKALLDDGYIVLQLDESTFNANAFPDRAWAPKKRPLQKLRRFV